MAFNRYKKQDEWSGIVERMANQGQEQEGQQKQVSKTTGDMKVSLAQQFDYSYLSVNSLYKNRIDSFPNRIIFSTVEQGESNIGAIGVSKKPTEVTQLKISEMKVGRKFIQTNLGVDDLYYSKIYMLVNPFSAQSFISADGFRYHFAFETQDDPKDLTQIIATPLQSTFNFSNPIRFNGEITFDFNTFRPYQLEEDQYEVYVDYTQPFMTLQRVNNLVHNLSNLDIIFLTNFDVPGILSKEDKSAATYRQNQYRISVIDAQRFQIPIVLPANIITSINRPADQNLGYYKYNIAHSAQPGIGTIITSQIQHGLVSGDQIQITESSFTAFNQQLTSQQWIVTVINATQFSIPFDSTTAVNQFTITVYEFPRISVDRQNTLFVRIATKKIEFGIGLFSQSLSANNNLVPVVL